MFDFFFFWTSLTLCASRGSWQLILGVQTCEDLQYQLVISSEPNIFPDWPNCAHYHGWWVKATDVETCIAALHKSKLEPNDKNKTKKKDNSLYRRRRMFARRLFCKWIQSFHAEESRRGDWQLNAARWICLAWIIVFFVSRGALGKRRKTTVTTFFFFFNVLQLVKACKKKKRAKI